MDRLLVQKSGLINKNTFELRIFCLIWPYSGNIITLSNLNTAWCFVKYQIKKIFASDDLDLVSPADKPLYTVTAAHDFDKTHYHSAIGKSSDISDAQCAVEVAIVDLIRSNNREAGSVDFKKILRFIGKTTSR